MIKRSHAPGIIILAVVLIGCNDSTESNQSSEPKLEIYRLADLPALGESLPSVLDNDRLLAAPPKQWHVASKSSKCLTRFQASRQRKYPSIILTAEEYVGDIYDVTEENVVEFARQRAAAMQQNASDARQKITLQPIKVGPFVGVSYRRRGAVQGQFKKIVLERLMLETVAFGRLYTIELRVREGEENEFRPHLLAVAGGLKFYDPEAPEEDEPVSASSHAK